MEMAYNLLTLEQMLDLHESSGLTFVINDGKVVNVEV